MTAFLVSLTTDFRGFPRHHARRRRADAPWGVLRALVNLARDMVADAIIGGATYTKFNNANCHLGVGSGNTAFSAAHTDLQGASKFRKAMDATYPQRAANVVTYRATYATGDANFAWEEVGTFNAAAAGEMLSRVVTTLGAKTAAASWVLTHTQTWVLV